MAVIAASARSIAAMAFVFLYPLVVNYGEMYSVAIDTSSPTYSGGFGNWLHLRAATSHESGIGATPIDMLCSWAWLDLRSEPWVFAMGERASDRFHTSRWVDLWGFVVGEIVPGDGEDGSPALLASPTWVGDVPAGVDRVVRGDSAFVRLFTSTELRTPEELLRVQNTHEQLSLEPLSAHLGRKAPAGAPALQWWPWRDGIVTSNEFWSCASFVMSLTTTNHQDQSILDRIAEIGLVAGEPWDPAVGGAEAAEAIDAGMDDALSELMRAAAEPVDPRLLHRSRTETDRDYFTRALGALGARRPRHLVGAPNGD